MRLPWQRGGDEADDSVARSATVARDERLSAYLDGMLARPDRADIEADAERDADMRVALEGMRAVRASLGELGMQRAPRSFTLSPESAPKQRGLPRLELYARFATVAAALALTVTALGPSFTGSVEERSGGADTSMAESRAAANAPAESQLTQKQADAPTTGATAAAAARAAATVTQAAPFSSGAAQGGQAAPAAAPQTAPAAPTSAAPPRTGAPATEGVPSTAATAAAELPPPSVVPVPLSNGRVDAGSPWWGLQLAFALATSVSAALAIGLWLRRRAGGGV
jgi:hypothetical protein